MLPVRSTENVALQKDMKHGPQATVKDWNVVALSTVHVVDNSYALNSSRFARNSPRRLEQLSGNVHDVDDDDVDDVVFNSNKWRFNLRRCY